MLMKLFLRPIPAPTRPEEETGKIENDTQIHSVEKRTGGCTDLLCCEDHLMRGRLEHLFEIEMK